MPTFDGGHCFLTALLPIATDDPRDRDSNSSAVHLIRERLSALPTAHQSPYSAKAAISPFALDDQTHFVRMAIIDDVIYNGRVGSNPLIDRVDPLDPQTVDQLNCPYLMFVVDCDAPKGTEAELKAYLRTLWTKTSDKLDPIFRHCRGFEADAGPDAFAAYVTSCMIDTTMPFNDYRAGDEPFKPPSWPMLGAAAFAAVVAIFAALVYLTGRLGLLNRAWPGFFGWLRPPHLIELVVLLVVAIGIVAAAALAMVTAKGDKPFPASPGSDLRSVLKALYLQRQFTSFAVAAQGTSDAKLFDAFRQFLAEHRPGDLAGPTQPPGTIPEPRPVP